jgi:hydroxyethylthiazole kinase-like uncharacterized protein yjeF
MKRILTADEMSRADAYAIQNIGIPSLVLMERAALGVAEEILSRDFDLSHILVVCGPGNNGGDGVAVARLFAERGIASDVLFTGVPEKRSEQLRAQINILKYYGINEVSDIVPGKYTLIIDAIFGIGLSRDVAGRAAEVISRINLENAKKVSVDISSGINADTGQVLGCAVKADLTVTFARAKAGHCLYPGKAYSGEVVVREIGIPVDETNSGSRLYAVDDADFLRLPVRNEYGNKATFGKLLVIAGSRNICGAAFFAACAALKCGIGMVRIITDSANRAALSTLLPEALIDTYDTGYISDEALKRCIDWADGVVIGPGLGTDKMSAELFERFLTLNDLPAVMDADALNLLAADEGLWNKIHFRTAVTPHIGEMCRLTGLSAKEIKSNALDIASDFAKKHDTVCVLKDAVTVTAYPDKDRYINTSGCSALASAGSGDVLSGIIGGLTVRYKDCHLPIEAFGVHLHGRCGETAGKLAGNGPATASDLLSAISGTGLMQLSEH